MRTYVQSQNRKSASFGTVMVHTSVPLARPALFTGPVLRRCACGGSAPGGSECKDCRAKPIRRSASAAGPATAPGIVYDVVRSPGAPLDTATREAMEPRFGHSFAGVRVHADRRAAESAAAVGALAYTLGSHVVFGGGRYAPDSRDGRRLLAHELAHVIQHPGPGPAVLPGSLTVGPVNAREEREADAAAKAAMCGSIATVGAATGAFLWRAAIHSGNIADEGSCEHVACGSKWACEDASGVECPEGTRNAFKKTQKKFSPLFACDGTCEKAEGCSDSENWMAIPHSRWTRGKCGQDLVICANGNFTHATLRDRSDRSVWEVSHGVQDDLAVSPYATFKGAIYADENDAAFKADARCGNVQGAKHPDAGLGLAPDAGPSMGDVGRVPVSDAGIAEAPRETN